MVPGVEQERGEDPMRACHLSVRQRTILRTQHGFLLAEILFAVAAILMAGVWLLGAYGSAIGLSSVAQQNNIAMNDLKDMLEKIKITPYSQLTANFPTGSVNGGSPDKYSAVVGGYGLTNEQITVTHQPNTAADPKELVVQVTWTSGSRQYSKTMTTLRTSKSS